MIDRRRARVIPALIAPVVVLVLSGCASTSGGPFTERNEPILIRVTNHNFSSVVIEAASTGRVRRLGEVETTRTATFRLPESMSDMGIRIVIDPVGPFDSFVTPAVQVVPGDLVIVTVESNIRRSWVTVR